MENHQAWNFPGLIDPSKDEHYRYMQAPMQAPMQEYSRSRGPDAECGSDRVDGGEDCDEC